MLLAFNPDNSKSLWATLFHWKLYMNGNWAETNNFQNCRKFQYLHIFIRCRWKFQNFIGFCIMKVSKLKTSTYNNFKFSSFYHEYNIHRINFRNLSLHLKKYDTTLKNSDRFYRTDKLRRAKIKSFRLTFEILFTSPRKVYGRRGFRVAKVRVCPFR